jgi:putative peptidoglycan lipid II flippase
LTLKKTSFVFVFVGVTHVLLVLRDLLLAQQFGSGANYQAFLVTMIVPGFFLNIVTAAINSSLVPKVSSKAGTTSPAQFSEYISSNFFAILVSILAACLFLGLASFLWLGPVVSGLDESQKAMAHSFLVPSLVLIFLQSCPIFLRVVLTATHRQALSTFSPLLNFSVLSGFLILLRPTNIESYLVQVSIGYFTEIIFILTVSFYLFRPPLKINLSKQTFKELFDQHFWYPVSSSILSASFLLVDQLMAARFPEGGVAALTYGQKITSGLIGVISGLIGYLIFPELAHYVSQKNWPLLRSKIRKYLVWTFCTSGILTLILCLFSYETIQVLFERGAFKNSDTLLVSKINVFYLLQIPFYLAGQISIKSLYSLQKGFYMTHIACVTIFVNALGNYVFSIWLGIPGISLSTSLVFALSSLAAYIYLNRELAKVSA